MMCSLAPCNWRTAQILWSGFYMLLIHRSCLCISALVMILMWYVLLKNSGPIYTAANCFLADGEIFDGVVK